MLHLAECEKVICSWNYCSKLNELFLLFCFLTPSRSKSFKQTSFSFCFCFASVVGKIHKGLLKLVDEFHVYGQIISSLMNFNFDLLEEILSLDSPLTLSYLKLMIECL